MSSKLSLKHAVEGEFVPLDEWIMWLRQHPLERRGHKRILPGCVWGVAGVGKTEIIAQFCEEEELGFKTYQPQHDRDAADIVGVPIPNPVNPMQMIYARPHWLPTDADPPGVLFIDEINRANELVLAGLMELLGEGAISQSGYVLPDAWQIVAAANPGETVYQVRRMDEAMVDRFVHYAPGFDLPSWVDWARRAGLNARVVEFALRHPPDQSNPMRSVLKVGEIGLPQEIQELLRATPRSLEYLATLLPDDNVPIRLVRTFSEGILGEEAARLFIEHWQDDTHPLAFADILSGAYRDELTRLLAANEENLIRGTTASVVGELVALTGGGSKPSREQLAKVATAVGRYFASLTTPLREEAFASVERSAPQWGAPLHAVCDAVLNKSGRKELPASELATGTNSFRDWN